MLGTSYGWDTDELRISITDKIRKQFTEKSSKERKTNQEKVSLNLFIESRKSMFGESKNFKREYKNHVSPGES